jgi:hypothetical protein
MYHRHKPLDLTHRRTVHSSSCDATRWHLSIFWRIDPAVYLCHAISSPNWGFSFFSLSISRRIKLTNEHHWAEPCLRNCQLCSYSRIPKFYGTRIFITVFTRRLHWSLFWARLIQSILPFPGSLRSILVLSTHLRIGLSVFFLQLNTWGYIPYVTPSLRREWVYRLQLLLELASAVIFGSEPRGIHDHILLSQIRDSPNLEGQVSVIKSPRNGLAQS